MKWKLNLLLIGIFLINSSMVDVDATQSTKWYYFDTGCDSAFEKYPSSGYGKQYMYIMSNVFSATDDYEDVVNQFEEAVAAKYKTWTRCTINGHDLEGPFDSENEALRARRETVGNHKYNDDYVIDIQFSYY